MPESSGTTALGKGITPPSFKGMRKSQARQAKGLGQTGSLTNTAPPPASMGTPKGQPQGRNMQDMIKRMAQNRLKGTRG